MLPTSLANRGSRIADQGGIEIGLLGEAVPFAYSHELMGREGGEDAVSGGNGGWRFLCPCLRFQRERKEKLQKPDPHVPFHFGLVGGICG